MPRVAYFILFYFILPFNINYFFIDDFDSQVIYTNKRQVWRCLLLSTTRRDETTKGSKTRSPRLHVRTNTRSHSQNPKQRHQLYLIFLLRLLLWIFLFSFSLPLFTHTHVHHQPFNSILHVSSEGVCLHWITFPMDLHWWNIFT